MRLAEEGAEAQRSPETRLAVACLYLALKRIADTIASQVLRVGSGSGDAPHPLQVFHAFAEHQR